MPIQIKRLAIVLMLAISFFATILITWTRVQVIYINNGPETDNASMELVDDLELADLSNQSFVPPSPIGIEIE